MALPSNFVTTLVEVGNLALVKLGEDEKDLITTLGSDGTTNDNIISMLIYQVIRSVQSDFRWDELAVRTTLSGGTDISDNDNYEYSYSHAIPDDYIHPMYDDSLTHLIESGTLYANSDDYVFKYYKYSEDPSEWSAYLLRAVYHSLAIEACLPITQDKNRLSMLVQEYEGVLLPRLQRLSSYSKKYPNRRRRRREYSNTRGFRY